MTLFRLKHVALLDGQTVCLIRRVALRLIMILLIHSSDMQQDFTCQRQILYVIIELLLNGDKYVYWFGTKYKQDDEHAFAYSSRILLLAWTC